MDTRYPVALSELALAAGAGLGRCVHWIICLRGLGLPNVPIQNKPAPVVDHNGPHKAFHVLAWACLHRCHTARVDRA